MDTGKVITISAVGVVLIMLYEWATSQCETPGSGLYGGSACNMLLGTPVASAVAPVQSTPISTAAPVTTAAPLAQTGLTNLLLQAAGFPTVNPPDLTPDQWAFYYNALPGKSPIPPAVFENILAALGLTDATRGTPVTVGAFVSAANTNGISGLGSGAFMGSFVPLFSIHGGVYA